MNQRGFQRLLVGHGRQNAGQAAGQHGFATAGDAGHQQVVSARRGNFQRLAARRLALDVFEIKGYGRVRRERRVARRGMSGQWGLARKVLQYLKQRFRRIQGQPFHAFTFPGVRPGQNECAHALPGSGDGHPQRTAHGHQPPVQRQLAQQHGLAQPMKRLRRARSQQSNRDGQFKRRTFLFHIRRGQVDRHLAEGKGQATHGDGRADAVAAFLDGHAGQADDFKADHPIGDKRLHLHGIAVYAA